MVTVFASAGKRPNETPTVLAFEHLVCSLAIMPLAAIAARAHITIMRFVTFLQVMLIVYLVFFGETKIFFVYFLQGMQR